MGAQAATGSAFTEAIAKKMEAPSFEDVLNLDTPKKPSPLKTPSPKDVGPKPETVSEGSKNIFEAAVQKAAEDKQKKKELTKALKEMQSKESADKYEASIKQAALEKLKAAQQAKKEKYGSYSPFSKSDMPTAQQYQNPYPEYLFKGKAPQYGEYGSNFMSVTAANNPLMQNEAAKQAIKNENEVDAYGEALKKNQLEQLLAMIAQGKQKGKQG
jgi:hypothetical protein